ncbi:MAG TPA: HNH endonuclease signature motif containing protein [Usitatibacter sp.]|nr:HNH endonuclease signature motif containing protein [Usitatibacter sp.]
MTVLHAHMAFDRTLTGSDAIIHLGRRQCSECSLLFARFPKLRRASGRVAHVFGSPLRDLLPWMNEKPPMWFLVGDPETDSRPLAAFIRGSWIEWHLQRGIDPYLRRAGLPRRLRERVIARDGLVCGICGGDVPRDDVHIDHIVPVSLGGADDIDNLRVAHAFCNVSRGNRGAA